MDAQKNDCKALFTAPVLLLALILAGCSAYPQTFRLTEQRFAPRPPEYPIALTESTFDNPFQKIAMVRTCVYEEWCIEEAGRAELKKHARKLGGDGVIQMRKTNVLHEKIGYAANSPSRISAVPTGKYYFTGIVVRFDRQEPRLAVEVGDEQNTANAPSAADEDNSTEKQP